jgi:hypothetical protein
MCQYASVKIGSAREASENRHALVTPRMRRSCSVGFQFAGDFVEEETFTPCTSMQSVLKFYV